MTAAERDREESRVYVNPIPHDYEGRSIELALERAREQAVERTIDRQLIDALHGQEMQRRIKKASA